MTADQCDQMVRLFLQYLFIYSNENQPNGIQNLSKRVSNFCQILNMPSKCCPKTLKILPKWQNFAKCGHTAADELEMSQQNQRQSISYPISLFLKLSFQIFMNPISRIRSCHGVTNACRQYAGPWRTAPWLGPIL